MKTKLKQLLTVFWNLAGPLALALAIANLVILDQINKRDKQHVHDLYVMFVIQGSQIRHLQLLQLRDIQKRINEQAEEGDLLTTTK